MSEQPKTADADPNDASTDRPVADTPTENLAAEAEAVTEANQAVADGEAEDQAVVEATNPIDEGAQVPTEDAAVAAVDDSVAGDSAADDAVQEAEPADESQAAAEAAGEDDAGTQPVQIEDPLPGDGEPVPVEEPERDDAEPQKLDAAPDAAESDAVDAEPVKVDTDAEPVKVDTDAEPQKLEADAAADAVAASPADASDAKAGDAEPAKVKVEEIESDEMIQLRAALDAKLTIEGQVIGWNKGGYHVALGKIAAFCPVSQIEIGNPRSPKKYLDKTFDFRVIEIQDGGRRVVVSRAAALRAKRAEEAAKVREELKQGAVLEGRVSSITDFGAFVNLGANIEGLVHVSEVSRKRVEHAKEVLKVGQKVKVQVLKIEKGGKRISLSMKRLEKDPWDGVAERFTSGGEFKGTIVRATEFGLFVEVEPGLEGLVHTSRLPLGANLEEDEELAVGKEIEGWVHDVDRKRRRLSLSMRPVAEGNPWKGVDERFPEGDIVEGKVEKVTKFGVFIELEPGLTGLLPFAVLGGGVSNPKRQFQPGKPVKVKVLSIDSGRKRISLGTEQSKAEGSPKDFKNYVKSQRKSESGLGALAQALAKVKDQLPVQ